jgi:hypothetical protein
VLTSPNPETGKFVIINFTDAMHVRPCEFSLLPGDSAHRRLQKKESAAYFARCLSLTENQLILLVQHGFLQIEAQELEAKLLERLQQAAIKSLQTPEECVELLQRQFGLL